ncbi:MAG: hypothetical protein RR320_00210, partial [Oscillospiraceae bacterium]
PEVQGILGHCDAEKMVISGTDALKALDQAIFLQKKEVVFLAQTTFNRKEWEKCVGWIKKVCTTAQIFDTICNATSLRQQEAAKLATCSEVMIVVGGRHSSNTAKLAAICDKDAGNGKRGGATGRWPA